MKGERMLVWEWACLQTAPFGNRELRTELGFDMPGAAKVLRDLRDVQSLRRMGKRGRWNDARYVANPDCPPPGTGHYERDLHSRINPPRPIASKEFFKFGNQDSLSSCENDVARGYASFPVIRLQE